MSSQLEEDASAAPVVFLDGLSYIEDHYSARSEQVKALVAQGT
jgi:hypothetical protein